MAFSSDETLFSSVHTIILLSAVINIIALQFTTAGYGRHLKPSSSAGGGGVLIPAALGWFLMESPTLWLSLLVFPHGRHRLHPLALLSLSLYLLHYVNRTIIYPLRLVKASSSSSSSKPLPLLIFSCAFVFNLLNAYLQSRSISHYASYGGDGFVRARVLVGALIFAWGMRVNVRSDLELVRLKKETGGGGYKIPRGGWFEWVCSPNYMGEAAEWLGWALVAWTPQAFLFFLYTCSNLVPRARAHLSWYKTKFGDEFPNNRKAIIPLLY